MTDRVLLVEDDPVLRRAVQDTLRAEDLDVDVAVDGREARALLGEQEGRYACVILDIMLPGPSGLEVLRSLRERDPHTPVLLLSARGEEHDKVVGLELGADDYVAKPFGKRELVARVHALLRRRRATAPDGDAPGGRFQLGDIAVDLDAFVVTVAGDDHPLSRTEAGMLALLWQRRGTAVSRDEFLRQVWEDHRAVGNRTVDTHMLNLRAKLESDPRAPRHLKTVHGVGYRLDP